MTTRKKVISSEPVNLISKKDLMYDDTETIYLDYDILSSYYHINPLEFTHNYIEENKDNIKKEMQLFGYYATSAIKDGDKIYLKKIKETRK